MREAIDNWAKARATSRREKVPNKHLVMKMMVMVMKMMVMVNMVVMVKMVVMVVMVLTTATIQKIYVDGTKIKGLCIEIVMEANGNFICVYQIHILQVDCKQIEIVLAYKI